jgi:ring-1,2-phenylacetyl-CoA epoxidase subunit PaaC
MTNTPDTHALQELLLSLADDELILGHRDAEWTGHGPILEEDIAFSNIAQDELGHSLVWFTLYGQLTGRSADSMAFERDWKEFRCCRFVSYPGEDFAYTVIRQYLFDEAEQVRLRAFRTCSYPPLAEAAAKIIREESYHLLHTRTLVERLGDATEESHQRMQSAVDVAFGQALGMFEPLVSEGTLIRDGVFPGNTSFLRDWLARIVPVLTSATLKVAVRTEQAGKIPAVAADEGGRRGIHAEFLHAVVDDMQSVYRTVPGGSW